MIGEYQPTEIPGEEELLQRWRIWAPEERKRIDGRLQRDRNQALSQRDSIKLSSTHLAAETANQLDDMIQDSLPYFARVRATFMSAEGEDGFSVDVRMHKYGYVISVPPDDTLLLSHWTAVADLVRNPSARTIVTERVRDGAYLSGAKNNSVLHVVQACVEDIMRDGEQWHVSPRYGAVYEDRVRRRLRNGPTIGFTSLVDVLSPRQNAVLSSREARWKVLILDGPAGTGKTGVATHRVSISAPHREGWYFAPTNSLRDYIRPALPVLGVDNNRTAVMTLRDFVNGLWPEFALASYESDKPSSQSAVNATSREWTSAFKNALASQNAAGLAHLTTFVEGVVATVRAVLPEHSSLDRLLRGLETWRVENDPQCEHLEKLYNQLVSEPALVGHPALRAMVTKVTMRPALEAARSIDWVAVYWNAIALVTHQSVISRIPVPQEDWPLLMLLAGVAQRAPSQPSPVWVVVDEAQSYPPVFYEALRRLVPQDASLILSGDFFQGLSPTGIHTWAEATTALGATDHQKRIWLQQTFRVPPAIFSVAERLRDAVQPDHEPTEAVPWHPVRGEVGSTIAKSETEVRQLASDTLRSWDSEGLSAVVIVVPSRELLKRTRVENLMHSIAKDKSYQVLDGTEAYRGGLAIGTPETIQGLEFDGVILWSVQESFYPGQDVLAAKRLYVAVTRARKAVMAYAVQGPTAAERRQQSLRLIGLKYNKAQEAIRLRAEAQAQAGTPLTPSYIAELRAIARRDRDSALNNLPSENRDDQSDVDQLRASSWWKVMFSN